MKIKFASFLFILAGLLFVTWSCEDDDDKDNNGDVERSLDAELFGYWEDENQETAWEFMSNGDLNQIVFGTEYEWEWESKDSETIEMWNRGTKKENAIVTEKIYKIENGKLYFWVDTLETWSVAYTKK